MAKRVEHLDALRGIAVAAVFAQHLLWPLTLWQQTPPAVRAAAGAVIHQGFNPGRFGVTLFFLLSGYVIPLSFRGTRPYRDFAVSRIFRLYPAYWLSVAVTAAVLAEPGIDGAQLLANLTMVQRLFGEADVNGVYWTLFVELVFYGLCVALFRVGRLTESWTLAAATLACAGASVGALILRPLAGPALPVQFLTYCLAFLFFGGLVRNALIGDRTARGLSLAVGAVLVASVPFASGLVMPVPPAQALPGGEGGIAAAYLAALALFVSSCLLRRPLGRPLLRLGALSYAVYLLHTPCLALAEAMSPPDGGMGEIGYALLAIGLTLAAAWACHRFVERPAIAWGRRIRFSEGRA